MQNSIKSAIDDSRSTFERQVDRVVTEMNVRLIEAIDSKIEDSQGSMTRVIDSKLHASMRELSEDVNTKMRDTVSGLWSKTQS